MRFIFKDKVRVKKGFYKGRVGEVRRLFKLGFFKKKLIYEIYFKKRPHLIDFPEDFLELVK